MQPILKLQELSKQAQKSYQEGRWEEAVLVCGQMLDLAPDFAPGYVQRGMILREMGAIPQAQQDFEQALRLDPDYGPAYYGRAWVRHALGDFTGEMADAQRGLELDPLNPESYLRRLGAAYQGLGQADSALKIYSRLVELNPRDEGTLFNRANLYFQLGNYPASLEDYARCLELDPDWAWALAGRGRTRLNLGQVEGCLEDCTQAIQIQPTYLPAYFYRAAAYEKNGELELAAADMQTVLGSGGDEGLRQMAARLLERLKPPRKKFLGLF